MTERTVVTLDAAGYVEDIDGPETFDTQPRSRAPVHPGEILKEKLAEMDMSQAEFARRTGFTPKHVNRIINGHAGYSADAAIRFERVTEISVAFWLSLQAYYLTSLALKDHHA